MRVPKKSLLPFSSAPSVKAKSFKAKNAKQLLFGTFILFNLRSSNMYIVIAYTHILLLLLSR